MRNTTFLELSWGFDDINIQLLTNKHNVIIKQTLPQWEFITRRSYCKCAEQMSAKCDFSEYGSAMESARMPICRHAKRRRCITKRSQSAGATASWSMLKSTIKGKRRSAASLQLVKDNNGEHMQCWTSRNRKAHVACDVLLNAETKMHCRLYIRIYMFLRNAL